MFCVLFEVQPRSGQSDTYFRLAAGMRAEVEKIDGFLGVERFVDTGREDAFLSFSRWRDEKSLIRWRVQAKHQIMQERGRSDIFRDYRIRIGELTADSAHADTPQQFRYDETETGDAKSVVFIEHATEGAPPISPDALTTVPFDSVTNPGRSATLTGWPDAQKAAAHWAAYEGQTDPHARQFRIVRDYTMQGREEAPQYFPEVAGFA